MSPELQFAIGSLVIAILGSVAALIRTLVFVVQQFSEIKVEAAKIRNDSEQSENKQSEIINDFVVDFRARIEVLQKKLERLTNENVGLQLTNAEYKGKLEYLNETLRLNVDKIEVLSTQIAQLNHDNQAKTELIATLKSENNSLVIERDRLNLEIIDTSNKLDSANAEIETLTANLQSYNGVISPQVALALNEHVLQQTASNIDLNSVQTATPADNDNDDKKDNK